MLTAFTISRTGSLQPRTSTSLPTWRFGQVFSDSIQQAISPEERSQVFVNKNHGAYSFNFLARTQVTSLPTSRIRIRELPSISIEKRPGLLSFLKKLPVYFSFEATAEGMSRKETVDDLVAFRAEVGGDPIISPSLVQRLDFHPRVSCRCILLALIYRDGGGTSDLLFKFTGSN